jgi:hypothetical protein
MPLTTNDFNVPDRHPYDTFGSYETENFMAWFLMDVLKTGDLYVSIVTQYDHPELVEQGFLERTGDREYRLTQKSIGILYTVYGRK